MREARERQRRRRRQLALLLLAVAGIGGVGYGIDRAFSGGVAALGCAQGACAAPAAVDRASTRGEPLYGFARVDEAPSTLSRVNPATLMPFGKSLRVPTRIGSGPVSPDGKHLILRGSPVVLSLVDLNDMRIESGIQARLNADFAGNQIVTETWSPTGQLLVVTQGTASQTLLAINPSTGGVRWKRALNTQAVVDQFGSVGDKVILLLGSLAGTRLAGTATVMAISPTGAVRSSTITLVRGGYRIRKEIFGPTGTPQHGHVALLGRGFEERLVTAGGRSPHAYVLTGGRRVYTIDPTTARATLHIVSTPTNAPAAAPPDLGMDAAPLGGNLAVTSFFPRPDGAPRAGLYLIDTADWTARLIDPATPTWFTTATSLITYTDANQIRPASWLSKGTGVRIYNTNGELRYHLYGTQAFTDIALGPNYTDAAVLPNTPTQTTPPSTPAQQRAYNASIRTKELLLDPVTGQTLGQRTIAGYSFSVNLFGRAIPQRFH